jgi:hypothetical protein
LREKGTEPLGEGKMWLEEEDESDREEELL